MAMKPVVTAVKNNYFSFFSVDGTTMAYREKNQIWNYGIAMKVQGDTWPGCSFGSYNSFGKKHLLTTSGGKVQTPEEKAAKILKKRMKVVDGGIAPTPKRQTKFAAIRKDIGGDKTKNNLTALDHFEVKAYGDQKTSKNTVILLDEFADQKEIGDLFAAEIMKIADWATNPDQHVQIVLGADTVMTLEHGQPTVYGDRVLVSVYFKDGIYHIYHLSA